MEKDNSLWFEVGPIVFREFLRDTPEMIHIKNRESNEYLVFALVRKVRSEKFDFNEN